MILLLQYKALLQGMKRFYFIVFFCLISFVINAQDSVNKDEQNLLNLILRGNDSTVDHVLNNAGKYHFQLILSIIDTIDGKENILSFDLNRDKYFFSPASLIKFPVAIVAAEKLSELKRQYNVGLDDSIRVELCSCDKNIFSYLKRTSPPTFRQILRETMIMSSNTGYNFFFNFLGKDDFNTRIRALGYDRINLRNRFYLPCSEEEQSLYGGISFLDSNGREKYKMNCIRSNGTWLNSRDWPHEAGIQHKENGKWVHGPKDYINSNYVSLWEAHHMLVSLMRSDSSVFRIDEEIKKVLTDAMGSFPRELNSKHYTGSYPDHYYKFFLDPVSMHTSDGSLRIYNKVGIAGGFISDVSFFHDKRSGLRFYLSAAMMAKKDGIPDNGKYDYYSIGIPVFRKIGAIVYAYLSRSIVQ